MDLSLTKKILLSVLGVGVVGSLVGMGTFASFTATVTNPNNSFSTGTLTLDTLQGSGSVAGSSLIAASDLKPGDSKTVLLEVKNTGSLPIASSTLATTASASSILDTNTTHGLRLTILRCSQAWTGDGPSASCGGAVTTERNNVPIIQAAAGIGSANLAAGGSDYYKITVSLPATADNTFQNQASSIVFTWTGSQTAGTDS